MSTASSPASAPDLIGTALYSLLLKGRAQSADIAHALGCDEREVDEDLRTATENGWAVQRQGRAPGWTLTGSGRQMVRDSVAGNRQQYDLSVLRAAYDRFLPANSDFKILCTAHQTTGADPLPELARIHAEATAVLTEAASADPRFLHYVGRLGDAQARIEGGDTSALVAPFTRSYHDVWAELHEDFLVMLAEERHEDD